MCVLPCLLVLVATVFPPAVGGELVRPPVEDLGMPFWCDWGYDWDAYFSSSSCGSAALRPRLVVAFASPTAGQSP